MIRGAKVRDHLEGGDEMLAARDLAAALVISRFTDAGLRDANAALRSETAAKLAAVLDDFAAERYPAGTPEVSEEMTDWIQSQSVALGQLAAQYNMTVETMLGKDDGVVGPFRQPFDKRAFGEKALFQAISAESPGTASSTRRSRGPRPARPTPTPRRARATRRRSTA